MERNTVVISDYRGTRYIAMSVNKKMINQIVNHEVDHIKNGNSIIGIDRIVLAGNPKEIDISNAEKVIPRDCEEVQRGIWVPSGKYLPDGTAMITQTWRNAAQVFIDKMNIIGNPDYCVVYKA